MQLYVRDPAGNTVEVNYPDAAALDRSVVGQIEKVPVKSQESAKARLYTRGALERPRLRIPQHHRQTDECRESLSP